MRCGVVVVSVVLCVWCGVMMCGVYDVWCDVCGVVWCYDVCGVRGVVCV